MRLFIEQFGCDATNFGDSLNAWLWNRLLPDFFDDDDDVVFVGIGTVLNSDLPAKTPRARRRLIFSSGAGYGVSPLKASAEDLIYCVRGPLSAQRLGVDSQLAITDGALLVRRFAAPRGPKIFKFSVMPHIEHIADKAWASICEELGYGYIDPRNSVDEILHQIDQSEALMAEAMHGAIVADLLRVPWIPIVTSANILSFKWQDWCRTVSLDYHPYRLSSLFNPRLRMGGPLGLARRLRYQARRETVLRELSHVARSARPMLSDERRLEDLTCRLQDCLSRLRSEWSGSACGS